MSLRSAALVAVASFTLFFGSRASAQVIIQGEVTAQPAPQGQQVQGNVIIQGTAPAGYGSTYTDPNAVYAQPIQAQPIQPQCPAGAQLMPNRWGQGVCMHEVPVHRVIGGLLGGGIGLLAGGYVVEIFTTLFTGIIGAFSTGSEYSVESLNSYVGWGFVPVFGSFVQMGFAPPFADTSLYVVLALESLVQIGGIVMIVFGVMGEDATEWRPIAGLDLQVRPLLGQTNGVMADLRF